MAITKKTFTKSCSTWSNQDGTEYVAMYNTMLQDVANYIVGLGLGFTIYSTTIDNQYYNGKYIVLKKDSIYLRLGCVPVYTSFAIVLNKNLTFTDDTNRITAKVIEMHASNTTTLIVNMVHYNASDSDLFLDFSSYNVKLHGRLFGFISMADIDGTVLSGYVVGTDRKVYDSSAVQIGTLHYLANTTTRTGYVLTKYAEVLDVNSQFIGKHATKVLSANSDGGMIENDIYTIDGKQYLYASNMLWEC